jgi:hypothetical protein
MPVAFVSRRDTNGGVIGGKRHHRHERWLHARISQELEEALRQEARRHRSPVSLVVRNMLESALELVDNRVEDSIEEARPARSRRSPARRAEADDVYGWQELILNRAAHCARCDAGLEAGEAAFRGLRDEPGPAIFQCQKCVRRLRDKRRKR